MSVEGDLEKIFIYSEENFNPKPIRSELGLEDKPASKNLPLHERNRLATLLWRTGNLTIMEMAKIGAYFAPGSRSDINKSEVYQGGKTDSMSSTDI